MLCAVLLFVLSYRIQATAKTELYFPILTVGFYSGSLMVVGYIDAPDRCVYHGFHLGRTVTV